ncbi:MAG: hypothetical protein HUJ54_04880 [Erysipelotrichaceae bacterium]|nr:hypothetical protein [Erysipelotrichaceae bacterium]
MKKVLLYSALGILIVVSAALGFVVSSELLMLMISALLASVVLMAAACIADQNARHWLGSYILVATSVLFYLFGPSPIGQYMLFALAIGLFIAAVFVYILWKYDNNSKEIVGMAVFAKLGLAPIQVMNYLLLQASGNSSFTFMNVIFLVITSAYSLLAIWKMAQQQMITKPAAWIFAVMQCMFVSDVLASIVVGIIALRYKEPVEEKKDPIYNKPVFQKSSRRKIAKKDSSPQKQS